MVFVAKNGPRSSLKVSNLKIFQIDEVSRLAKAKSYETSPSCSQSTILDHGTQT